MKTTSIPFDLTGGYSGRLNAEYETDEGMITFKKIEADTPDGVVVVLFPPKISDKAFRTVVAQLWELAVNIKE